MPLRHASRLFAVLSLVLIASAGCARRSVKAPPPAEPVTRTEAPVKTETPAPAPPAETAAFTPVSAYFGYDSAVLDDAARSALDAAARALRAAPATRVVIEGHCDERGTVEYNQALGERRADAARAYLEAAGVERSRMRTVSYGKERPFVTGSNEAAWAKNRCAQIIRD